jgi:UPF0176 protein
MMATIKVATKSAMSKTGAKVQRLAVSQVSSPVPFKVAALYHFGAIEDPATLQQPLLKLCLQNSVRGTLLLANEGINGTIAGPDTGIEMVLNHVMGWRGFETTAVKFSTSTDGAAFHHMRIKIKPEIVTMGKPDIDPVLGAGTYVEPRDWNALIKRADVTVIDTRNDYEIHIGKFKGAVNPETETFRDFPAWADKLVQEGVSGMSAKSADSEKSTVPVRTALAMYCTGGIRCEKATAYMKQLGVKEVYHLKGGILKYLEEVPEEESLWEGECFVFDERVALKHDLQPGSYTRCFGCKRPLSAEDCALGPALYEEGVYCKHCVVTQTEAQRERFRSRQRQIMLARQRGEEHVGQRLPTV